MKLTDKFDKRGGIYIIKNSINGKIYIGETLNMKSRINGHIYSNIQVIDKAINKYGVNNFEILVEYLPHFKKMDLILVEETLINKFGSLVPNGYNVCSTGTDRTGLKHSELTRQKISISNKNKVVSEETRRKLSISKIGSKLSTETKTKMSISRIGKKWKEESRLKLSDSKSRTHTLVSPDKQTIEIFNLCKFAKENNLNVSKLCLVEQGNRLSHKGWTSPVFHRERMPRVGNGRTIKHSPFKLKSENGTIYSFNNNKEAAVVLKTCTSNISSLRTGKYKHCKGYKLYE